MCFYAFFSTEEHDESRLFMSKNMCWNALFGQGKYRDQLLS